MRHPWKKSSAWLNSILIVSLTICQIINLFWLFNRRFSNGTENTIPWVLEQVDQNGMMGPPMGRVHPSIVGCLLGSFIGQIGHVPKIYPLYRVNFNRASWPPWVTEAKPFYHQLYVYRCPWKSHKKVGQKMPTLVGNQFFLICCPMGISPTWHGILGNVLGLLESSWGVLSDERIKRLGSWNLDPETADWKIVIVSFFKSHRRRHLAATLHKSKVAQNWKIS